MGFKSGDSGGGAGIPGGLDSQVQYNDAGSFTGSARLTFDDTLAVPELFVSGSLNVTGSVTVNGVGITGSDGWHVSPGGAATHIQYSDGVNFQGASDVTYDGTALTVASQLTASGGSLFTGAPVVITSQLTASGGSLFTGAPVVITSQLTASEGATFLGSVDVHHTGSRRPANLGSSQGTGEIVYYGTGSTFPAGSLFYLNADGGWEAPNAAGTGSLGSTGAGNASLLGIALGTDPSTDGMLLRGHVNTEAFPGLYSYVGAWQTGSAVYVASGSGMAGAMTGSAPDATDSYVRVVGYCTPTVGVIRFDPDSVWVEIS